jgi:hypothetical protein
MAISRGRSGDELSFPGKSLFFSNAIGLMQLGVE